MRAFHEQACARRLMFKFLQLLERGITVPRRKYYKQYLVWDWVLFFYVPLSLFLSPEAFFFLRIFSSYSSWPMFSSDGRIGEKDQIVRVAPYSFANFTAIHPLPLSSTLSLYPSQSGSCSLSLILRAPCLIRVIGLPSGPLGTWP